MTRAFYAVVCTTAALVSPVKAQAQPEPLSLATAIARAIEHNPALAAARLQRPIDAAGVAVAGERPNPDLSYEISKETPRQSIGVSVPLELGGKRGSRVALATATAAAGEADLNRLVSDFRNDVRRTYFDLVAARRRVELLEEVKALSDRARAAAVARVDAGDVPRSDLTQADLTVATSENDLIAARGEAAASSVALNVLLGQPAATPIAPSNSLLDGALMTAEDAIALANEASTELQALDRRIVEQRMRADLARAMQTPDLSAGTALTFDAEPEFKYGWRLNAGLTLPVFTTHRSAVVLEDATLSRMVAERQAAALRVTGAVAAAMERANAARAQVTQYEETILPLATEAERQAQTAYAGGQTGLATLIQSLQTARDTRQRGLQAALDYQRALADLERAIGAPLK